MGFSEAVLATGCGKSVDYGSIIVLSMMGDFLWKT